MINKEGVISLIEELKRILSSSNDVKSCSIKELFFQFIEPNLKNYSIFISSLSNVEEQLKKDLDYFLKSDPAATNKEEILITYPGYLAITHYRVAHILFKLGYKVASRIITEQAHVLTGIDIHPGCEIDSPFFIDHGTGIVIGETTIIGKNVKLYQGVTLGALSLSKGERLKGIKRHPTIKDNVTIYSGASILGGDVVIGNNVTIGSNVFLMESIPDNMLVSISKPELVLKTKNK